MRELYFPNRWLPMKADLFNRVSAALFAHRRGRVCLDAGVGVRAGI
ncbi:hypothetical protein M8494_03650 [Serratia ureilytica]